MVGTPAGRQAPEGLFVRKAVSDVLTAVGPELPSAPQATDACSSRSAGAAERGTLSETGPSWQAFTASFGDRQNPGVGKALTPAMLGSFGLALAGLWLSDLLALSGQRADQDVLLVGLMALYAAFLGSLAASAYLCRRYGLSLPAPCYVAIALLLSGVVLASALWQEGSWEVAAPQAARVAAAMQPLLAFLSPRGRPHAFLAVGASSLAVLVPVAIWATEALLESLAIVAFFSAAALWTARTMDQALAVREQTWLDFKEVLIPVLEGLRSPIVNMSQTEQAVTTEVDILMERLKVAREAIVQSDIEHGVRSQLASVFSFLRLELKNAAKGDNDKEMILYNDETPMTELFLAETLNTRFQRGLSTQEEPLVPGQTERPSSVRPTPDGVRTKEAGQKAGQKAAGSTRPPSVGGRPPRLGHRAEGEASETLTRSVQSLIEEEEVYSQVGQVFTEMMQAMAGPAPAAGEEAIPFAIGNFQLNLEVLVGKWDLDVFAVQKETGHALVQIGHAAIRRQSSELRLDDDRVAAFLQEIELRYQSQPYHNSMHAADVLNGMLYYLQLNHTAFQRLLPVDMLAGMVAALAHDVGHTGTNNRFHVNSQTSLATLFSDQSVLENMHCTLTFAVLRLKRCDFTANLGHENRRAFRNLVIKMVLETDLSKHMSSVSHFRQEFLYSASSDGDANGSQRSSQEMELSQGQLDQLLAFILKASDVAHSAKPFDLHSQWTMRINTEFFTQGDMEQELCLPVSPFCDRRNTDVADSQLGFFKFIVSPMYEALDKFLASPKMRFEVLPAIEKNRTYWTNFEKAFLSKVRFNYDDPMSNVPALQKSFVAEELERMSTARRAGAVPRLVSRQYSPDSQEGSSPLPGSTSRVDWSSVADFQRAVSSMEAQGLKGASLDMDLSLGDFARAQSVGLQPQGIDVADPPFPSVRST